MSDQDLDRYIELKDIIKENNKEMKPLKKEMKELEQLILDSGKTEIDHYGIKIKVVEKTTEKMNKEEVDALIAKEIRTNQGNGLEYTDFYEPTKKRSVKLEEIKLNQKD